MFFSNDLFCENEKDFVVNNGAPVSGCKIAVYVKK